MKTNDAFDEMGCIVSTREDFMILFIITVRDKNGKVIQSHERTGYESCVALVAALIENPTWRISIRQA